MDNYENSLAQRIDSELSKGNFSELNNLIENKLHNSSPKLDTKINVIGVGFVPFSSRLDFQNDSEPTKNMHPFGSFIGKESYLRRGYKK